MKSLEELIALAKNRSAIQTNKVAVSSLRPTLQPSEFQAHYASRDMYGNEIELNAQQGLAVEYALSGRSFVLTGAAGTGKTTTVQAIMREIYRQHGIRTVDTKYGPTTHIYIGAYTRKATNNIKKAISRDPELAEVFADSCMTLHMLLEFEPVSMGDRETRIFLPKRDSDRPVGHTVFIIEESSMLGLDLGARWIDALPHGAESLQVIFLGDINQLPPVFGDSVLNFALTKLPVVELNHVYRQALDNPIISAAHCVLNGKEFRSQYDDAAGKGIAINGGKNKTHLGIRSWISGLDKYFQHMHSEGQYDPNSDIILCPQNVTSAKSTGSNEINIRIAQYLGQHRQAMIYPVLTGFATWMLAVGDRVLVDKLDGEITYIVANPTYRGISPAAQVGLDRHPHKYEETFLADIDLASIPEFSLEDAPAEDGEENTQRPASHIVRVDLEDGTSRELKSSGDFSPAKFSYGYCISVHKSQGSEYPKVFFAAHITHAHMMSRELLYTGITRAQEACIILAKEDIIRRAINAPRLRGNTLEDKIQWFNAKCDRQRLKFDWGRLENFIAEQTTGESTCTNSKMAMTT